MPPVGRRRGSALCTGRNPAASLWCGNTSQALRASSPQGEPSLSGNGPQSLSLRRGGTASAVTERCAAAQRRRRGSALTHRPKPCGKSSARQHLSGASRQLPSRGAFPLRQRAPKPLLEERWHGEAVTERCAARRAAARKRPYAQAETLRQTFGALTPLRRFAPAPLKGSLPSQATGLKASP